MFQSLLLLIQNRYLKVKRINCELIIEGEELPIKQFRISNQFQSLLNPQQKLQAPNSKHWPELHLVKNVNSYFYHNSSGTFLLTCLILEDKKSLQDNVLTNVFQHNTSLLALTRVQTVYITGEILSLEAFFTLLLPTTPTTLHYNHCYGLRVFMCASKNCF